MSGQITLRPARDDEAKALAALHVTVWRESYAAYAPAKALKTLDATRRLPAWQRYLASESHHVLVAEQAGLIIGVVCFGAPGNAALGPRREIAHLYVASPAKRQGVGRRLLLAALTQIAADGHTAAALAVVRENATAIEFYKSLGGVEQGSFTDAGPLWKSDNLIMVWDNLETVK